MTDAQTWTLIVGFLAVLLAVVTSTSSMLLRVLRAEISGLGAQLGGRIDGLERRLDGAERRLGDKIDRIDGDVQAIVRRLMDG